MDAEKIKMEQEGYIEFTKVHAFFLVCSILTYLGDIILDIVLAISYLHNGYYWYCLITVILTLLPSLAVQVFSVRWHQLDELMSKTFWVIHAALLGVVQRYFIVINLGFEARRSKLLLDYQRYYQQQSDVCMLRLFDSFLESAPQLVFHLYVMIEKQEEWRVEQAVWTAVSALTSMISLGWGIAAYSSAMRMVKAEKRKMTWMGMILQTIWRFGMLSARIVALVLLTLALKEWVIIVLFAHWLLMTGWVLCQETDFCENPWEERFYNAIVGVIYCFCFFNLKEGQSRFRATTFYFVIILENFFFLAIYFYLTDFGGDSFTEGMSIGAFVIMTVGTATGIAAMLLYYRYFHPVGPINPCHEYADSNEKDKTMFAGHETPGGNASFHDRSRGPDFEIQSEDVFNSPGSGHELETPPRPPPRRVRVQHSRSFKDSCPPAKRSQTPKKPKKSNHKKRMAAVAATRETSCSPWV